MLKIEMQTRCVKCGAEQYAMAVWDISHGKHPCCWCGEYSKPMTTEEYQKALTAFRESQK